MTPTRTAAPIARQVPPTRMPLPGDPEDAAIDEACRDLRLPAFRERFTELAATARREQSTYKQFLLDLLQVEVADRDVRRQQRLVRSAKFPRPKRLEDFAFEKNPNVSPKVIADRITFRCTLIQTGTDSHRYQATQDERQGKKKR